MAYKTFLQLYTDALVQADETAGSGSATAKTIIKAGINESYAEVSSIRDWETLLNNTAVTLTVGTWEYTPITNSSTIPRIRRIVDVLDETSNRFLKEEKQDVFEEVHPYIDQSAAVNQGAPVLWFPAGYTSNRDIKIRVWQVPNGTYTARVRFFEEPVELVADGDIPRIPDQYHYGLPYLGLAKYFEYQKDPISAYYRQMHEQFKQKILENEWDNTVEMPEILPESPNRTLITGKLGRIYNR